MKKFLILGLIMVNLFLGTKFLNATICSTELGSISIGNTIADMKVVGNFVYVAASRSLKIIDITARDNPWVVSTLTIPNNCYAGAVEFVNNTVYVLDSAGRIHSINVTYP